MLFERTALKHNYKYCLNRVDSQLLWLVGDILNLDDGIALFKREMQFIHEKLRPFKPLQEKLKLSYQPFANQEAIEIGIESISSDVTSHGESFSQYNFKPEIDEAAARDYAVAWESVGSHLQIDCSDYVISELFHALRNYGLALDLVIDGYGSSVPISEPLNFGLDGYEGIVSNNPDCFYGLPQLHYWWKSESNYHCGWQNVNYKLPHLVSIAVKSAKQKNDYQATDRLISYEL